MKYPNYFAQVAEVNFVKYLNELMNKNVNLLQIGVFRGDASLFLCENILSKSESRLHDVDLWGGTTDPSHTDFDFVEIENDYDKKLVKYLNSGQIIKYKQSSETFFKRNKEEFDFIYIDGNHSMLDVLRDGLGAFPILKSGGILAFDDYGGGIGNPNQLRPGPAIDALLMAWDGEYELIEKSYQVWIKKA